MNKKNKNLAKKSISNKSDGLEKLENIKKVSKKIKNEIPQKKINNEENVCNFIKKCDIDEISKYLINKGMNKDYPNISVIK